MIPFGTRRKIIANVVLGIGLGLIVCGTCPHWDFWHLGLTIVGFALVGVSAFIRHVRCW